MSKNSILDLYTQYATECTDAPSKYHRYCAAAMVATILGRRAWFQLGHATVFPNLWVCLIGQSTLARKSTSSRIALDIIARVNADLILPSKVTTESLYKICANPERPEGLRGIGIMNYGELHTLLSSMSRDYNSELKSTMTDWYDCPAAIASSTVGNGTMTVKHPAITILAASTMAWLVEAAQTRDIHGGFYPRWLFAVAGESDQAPMPLPPPRDEEKANAIISKLKQLLDFVKYEFCPGSPHGRCHFSESGEKEYRNIYGEMRAKYYGNELLGAFAGRAQVQTVKLAIIHALATQGSQMIGGDSVRWGYELVRESIVDVAEICLSQMGDSRTEVNLNKLHRFIRTQGPQGVSKTAMLQRSGFRDKEYLEKLLKNLMAADQIIQLPAKRTPGQRGRLAEIYIARDFDLPPVPQNGAVTHEV